MKKENKLIKSITDAIKICIIIAFLIAVLFVTVISIDYSINHNLVILNIITSDEIKRKAVSIPSQDSEEALIRQDKEINPIEYLKTTNTSAIPVKPSEKVVLKTKNSFLIETRKSNKDLFIRAYKDGDKTNKVEFSPEINIKDRYYEITFNAPQESGVYTYYLVLRFNRYDAEYMFNLEVI